MKRPKTWVKRGGEEPEEPTTGTLSVTGIPKIYDLTLTGEVPTVKVDMASEKGIKSLVVSISSDNKEFPVLLRVWTHNL